MGLTRRQKVEDVKDWIIRNHPFTRDPGEAAALHTRHSDDTASQQEKSLVHSEGAARVLSLNNLHNNLNKARDKIKSSPWNHNKANPGTKDSLPQYGTRHTRKPLKADEKHKQRQTRKTSKTVTEQVNQLKTEKVAANIFADMYYKSHVKNANQGRQRGDHVTIRWPKFCRHLHEQAFHYEWAKTPDWNSIKAHGPGGVTGDMQRRCFTSLTSAKKKWAQLSSIWKEAEITPTLKKNKDFKKSHEVTEFWAAWANKVISTQTGYRKFRTTEDQLVH